MSFSLSPGVDSPGLPNLHTFMAHLHFRAVGTVLLFLSLAEAGARLAWGQAVSSAPKNCAAGNDHHASLTETENLVRAEVFEAAECRARELTAAQPESADAHYLLGYILNRTDQPNESLQEYTAGARYRHPTANDLAVVSLDYALLKDYTDAAKWMTQALAGEPKNAEYWYYLGRIWYSLNDFGKARDAFLTALRMSPDNTRDFYNLGLTYEGLGDTTKAANLYQQAIISEHPGAAQDAQPYYDLGSLLSRQNKTVQALPLLEKAITLDPRNPGIRERLAKAEEQTGQLERSRKDLEFAVSLESNVSSLHFELGHVYQKLHMMTEAKQQFDICRTMFGTHSIVGSDNFDFAKP